MSRRRFYASPDQITAHRVTLASDETHHLVRVLRLQTGDEVFVFDGVENEYRCRFLSAKGGCAELEIIERLADTVESPLTLTLAQAVAKGEKFDLIVQKATELGVSRIAPLLTEKTDVKLNTEQAAKRVERWRRISLESLKQSGRRRLVEIRPPATVAEFVNENAGSDSLLVFSERGGVMLHQALAECGGQAISALVGPEGGWSGAELLLLEERGAKAVTLGPRVLRTETAGIVALALLQHALGDLSN